jgi:hypothetical protein
LVPSNVPVPGSTPELTPEQNSFTKAFQGAPSLLLSRLWQQRAGPVASELEACLIRNGVPEARRFCALCWSRGEAMQSQSLAAHLTNDPYHLARVEDLLDMEGPDGPSWTQTWPGTVQIHHLNLELTKYESSPHSAMNKDSDAWEEYSDPTSNKVWWYNPRTQEATWTDPHQY